MAKFLKVCTFMQAKNLVRKKNFEKNPKRIFSLHFRENDQSSVHDPWENGIGTPNRVNTIRENGTFNRLTAKYVHVRPLFREC